VKRKKPVNSSRLISGAFLLLLCFGIAGAGELASYRGFRLGMTVGAVVKRAGMDISEATMVHQKPARIQELSWAPMRFSSDDTDPVEQVKFTFWNGQLYKMVVSYAGHRTTGLTPRDMIDALSAKFGVASNPGGSVTLGETASSERVEDQVKVLAHWGDEASSIELVQSPYDSNYQLLIHSKHLDAIAQAAWIEGARLDALEAPQREKNQEQEAQNELAKSRALNKGNFRP
jgi:hypothetical protein